MRVALINPPFNSVTQPHCGLSTFKEIFTIHYGIDAKVFYPNIEFAKTIGYQLYGDLQTADLTALELLAARKGYGTNTSIRDIVEELGSPTTLALLITTLRSNLEVFIDQMSKDACWGNYDIIGLSCREGQVSCAMALSTG